MICRIVSGHAGQRPYSIRTRIKTKADLHASVNVPCVRDHIPLEQGLRLDVRLTHLPPTYLSETIFH